MSGPGDASIRRARLAAGAPPSAAPRREPPFTPASQTGSSFGRARRVIWTLILLFILTWAIGKNWDAVYHVTHLFDTFWSPPHVFVYSGYLLVALIFLVSLLWMREIHPHLGPAVRVPLLAFPVPAAWLLLGSGLLFTGLAGLIDSRYHEALGLRETHWSVPHLMLGASGFLVVAGLAAAFIALGRLSRGTLPLVFWGMFVFAVGTSLGPAFDSAAPEDYRRLLENRIPGVTLAIGEDLRWALETYLAHGLMRNHPVVVPVVAFIGSTLLAAHRGIRPGRWSGLGWALLFTALSALDTLRVFGALKEEGLRAPAHVFPFPLLPMVLAIGLLEGRTGRWAWLLAGGLAGGLWGAGPAGILSGALASLAGREAGRGLLGVLAAPTRRSIVATALLLGVVVPIVLGGLDIALRAGKYWWLLG